MFETTADVVTCRGFFRSNVRKRTTELAISTSPIDALACRLEEPATASEAVMSTGHDFRYLQNQRPALCCLLVALLWSLAQILGLLNLQDVLLQFDV